jgi:hypothetical protein
MEENKNKYAEVSKMILKGLLLAGAIGVAATSPRFSGKVLPLIFKYAKYKYYQSQRKKKNARKRTKKYNDAFSHLIRKGYVQAANRNGQIYISLTKEGKKKAKKWQIDDLSIEKPDKWDGKWRILIFDIADDQRVKREALRGKIKQLGLFQLQKSVWIYPFEFSKEIALLRDFFGLTNKEMQIILATKVENDKEAKTHFGL